MPAFAKNLRIGVLAVLTLGAATMAQAEQDRFTIAVIPDTQNYVDYTRQRAEGFPFDAREMMVRQMEYIAANAVGAGGDIVFATSVGDVWQHPTTSAEPGHAARGFSARPLPSGASYEDMAVEVRNVEIPAAVDAYRRLAGKLPFSVVPGNHDYDAQWWEASYPQDLTAPAGDLRRLGMIHIGGLTEWTRAFGAQSDFFRDQPWYVASHDNGADSAQIFSAGGYRFLHIGLQMAAPDASLQWAETVIHAHAGLPTLISTHDFIDTRAERRPHPVVDLNAVDPFNNTAQAVWDKLIARNPQIFMVLSGHHHGQAFRIDTNNKGGAVYQILSDYQDRKQSAIDAGQTPENAKTVGDGWMRLMTFDMSDATPSINIRTYSTHYQKFSSDLPEYADWYRAHEQPNLSPSEFLAADEFTIELSDFRARFDPSQTSQ